MEVLKELQAEIEKVENIEEFQNLFYKYANKLMNEYYLQIGDVKIKLCEVEFYCYSKNKHSDIYAHCNDKQKTIGKLYVHKNQKGVYTNTWNRGGVDITFGNDNYYGGILIRTIEFDDNCETIMGPAKVRQHIALKLNLINEEKENFNHKDLQNKLDNIKIVLNKKEFKNDKNILKSCRVGLTLSNQCYNSDLEKKFIFKPYRYILNDENLIKELLSNSNQEPTFLAWFIKNKNDNFYDNLIEKSNIKTQIDNLLKNVSDENQDKWKSANKSKEKERKEFINFISHF